MSALSQIAKDPSCILAVDALQGGRWLSCIKPDGVQPSAPSGEGTWEERTRLLTLTNITTAGGVFRAADDAKVAGIATPLDFRGNTTSKTFIVRAFCPAHDPDSGKLYIHPLLGQGQIGYGNAYSVFSLAIWEDFRTAGNPKIMLVGRIEGENSSVGNYAFPENALDSWHVFSMIVDYDSSPGNMILSRYIDRILLNTETVAAQNFGSGAASSMSEHVGIREDPVITWLADTRVAAALIFDRALTQPEIAALSYAVV